ncbi:tyrosine/phenylalanine carboxypeptidase domain-containing protein [Candidatus Nanosalina sp. VS9-1]|uniref:tyrosine/phenylalanine carboxypeptidase domain-containing protein n=1 Tax=Candidatus Nanosalina sp. VS9-1 TaxID=3388566 RepID=UPI0039E01424
MSNKTLKDIDRAIRELRSEIEIYSRVTPENSEEARKKFEESIKGEVPESEASVREDVVNEVVSDTVASSITPDDLGAEEIREQDIEDPEFEYIDQESFEDVRRELARFERDLDETDASETVKEMYRDTIEEGMALIDIAENLGDPEAVQEASRRIYGEPSESTVEWADEVLQNEESADDPRYTEGRFSTTDMKESLEKTLALLDMEEWTVDTREKGSMKVNAANQEVSVPEGREFTENEMMRLLVHEIGTHALRGANGYKQEFGVMGSGTGHYHQAAEGIAFFLEEATGLSNPDNKKKYAARVKSVESVMDGNDFTDTYIMNREFGFDHDKAWNISLRAHRGGGFIKDHIYAEGFRQIEAYLKESDDVENSDGLEEFMAMDGHLEDLMAGKISVEQGYNLRGELEAEYSPMTVIENLDYLTPDGVDTSVVDVDPRLQQWYSQAS